MSSLFKKDNVLKYMAKLYADKTNWKCGYEIENPQPQFETMISQTVDLLITEDRGRNMLQEFLGVFSDGYTLNSVGLSEGIYEFTFSKLSGS